MALLPSPRDAHSHKQTHTIQTYCYMSFFLLSIARQMFNLTIIVVHQCFQLQLRMYAEGWNILWLVCKWLWSLLHLWVDTNKELFNLNPTLFLSCVINRLTVSKKLFLDTCSLSYRCIWKSIHFFSCFGVRLNNVSKLYLLSIFLNCSGGRSMQHPNL